MEIAAEDLEFEELLDLYRATQEFIEFLETEEKTEVEKRKK